MFRAHELLAALNPESGDYKKVVAAIKFDLGEINSVVGMFGASSRMFFNIPAPICLFQVTNDMDLHFFLAEQDCGGTIWRRYGKILADGFRWVMEDIEFFVDEKAEIIITKRISTGEVLTNGPEKPSDKLTAAERWTIERFIIVAASIEVFSCSNVSTVEHLPPKFINESRAKKGKPPFFSYRTLHITGTQTESNGGAARNHASPRLHFRRGHVRRIANDRRVWVSSCLVGDKSQGFAAHDYKVRLDDH